MGLLDQLFGTGGDDPRSQAMGLLGAGLMAGNPAQAFGQANGLFAQASGNALKKKLLEAQLEETLAHGAERKGSLANKERVLKMQEDAMRGYGDSPSQSSPPIPPMNNSPLGSGTYGIPVGGQPGSAPMPAGAAELNRLRRMAISGVPGAKELFEIYKYENEPQKLEQGSTYVDRRTGSREVMPKIGEGIGMSNGVYSDLPGYANSQANIEAAKARAVEAAKSESDAMKVVNPATGAEEYRTRSQVLQAARPAPAIGPRPSASEASLRPLMQGGIGADSAALQREIAALQRDIGRVADPSSRKMMTDEITRLQGQQASLGPMQASPSSQQRADAESLKTTAESTAKDVAETRKGIMNAGFSAPSTIAKYQQLGKLLQNIDGGTLTATGTHLASTMNSLGIKIDKELPNKEAAAALGNQMALELRSPANGAGMPGAMSDADRNYLVSMIPNAGQTTQGRQQLIDAQISISKRQQQVSTFARNYEKKYGRLDNGFFEQMQSWSEANPLFKAK